MFPKGSRFRTYYDFGYVALDIIHVTSIDSGEYTVRATNHLGSAHTSACVNVNIIYTILIQQMLYTFFELYIGIMPIRYFN